MKTSAIQTMVLQPINTDKQPKADADAPLFLPADARRRWYLGFLHHWKDYQRHVIQHWESEGCKRAFDEIKDHEMAELQPAAPAAGEDDKAPAKFETMFRREVLEIVESVYNQLLATKTMKHADACNLPEHIALRKTETDHAAKPRFWFRAKVTGRDEELRLFGHAEYLGGRPGALSSAVEQAAKNSWGSLRCVLGDLAWYMLKHNITYGFVVSSDEIMFLRFDIDTCIEQVNINSFRPDCPPMIEWMETVEEPHLWYSDPIKFTDDFDSAEGKVTVNLGLLHLIHEVVTKACKMQDQKGRCARYFRKTEAEEKWVPRPPRRR